MEFISADHYDYEVEMEAISPNIVHNYFKIGVSLGVLLGQCRLVQYHTDISSRSLETIK